MHSVLVNGFSYFREFVRTASAALKDMPSMLYSLKVIEKKTVERLDSYAAVETALVPKTLA